MDYLYNKPESKTKRRLLRNNMPQPEQRLWYYLKGKGLKGCKFRRQYGVSVYTLDFYCPQQRLAIELDGDSHFNPAAERRDEVREQFLKSQNITVLRFTNAEANQNIEEVIGKISKYLP